MTKCNTLDLKFSNPEVNQLKSGIKYDSYLTLNLSSNVIGNSNDEINFPQNLLLTDKQLSSLRKAFPNVSSANIKFSKG